MDFIEKLLKLTAQFHSCDSIFWDEDLRFYVNCNDVFDWGCSDAEEVTPENIHLLEQSFKDDRIYAETLFCARVRKIRPQGAAYPPKEREKTIQLLNECGPERKTGLGNPYKNQEDYKKAFYQKKE